MAETALVLHYKIKTALSMNVWVGKRTLYETNKVVSDPSKELEIQQKPSKQTKPENVVDLPAREFG